MAMNINIQTANAATYNDFKQMVALYAPHADVFYNANSTTVFGLYAISTVENFAVYTTGNLAGLSPSLAQATVLEDFSGAQPIGSSFLIGG
jgi:hypothetical protein